MLFKGDKGVSDVARPFKGGPAKVRIEWLLRDEGNELTQSQGQRGLILTVELYSTMVSIIP